MSKRTLRSQTAATHAVANTPTAQTSRRKRKSEPRTLKTTLRYSTLIRGQTELEVSSWLARVDLPPVQAATPPQLPLPDCPPRTIITSWFIKTARSSIHTPIPSPPIRQNCEPRWPHGVLSGGMAIDILECLTATAQPDDWALALWLQTHYVEPFARIERLDGLVIQSSGHVEMLQLAHKRFVGFVGYSVHVQRLWVPGLEPTYAVNNSTVIIPNLPRRFERKIWRASEMYYKHGSEVKRRGKCLGAWRDDLQWQRTLWTAQSGDEEQKPKNGGLAWVEEDKIQLDEDTVRSNMGGTTTGSRFTAPLDAGNTIHGLPSPPKDASRLQSPATEASLHTLFPGDAQFHDEDE